ncbi:hypothetical protein PVA44_00060 [Entomospira nematocerorum]|uniref:Uncharacterized protein n=1 Tax=Entomospira nematocerorum TaxID=2719987 RepID=A0A968GD24_9SPIO|nr:hypothetical protein [Entomospira nematocera]NIZ47564.1 hypothetical protein [Entomospira nematocera]WDI33897.1 hypothetical protein PVA44_00060 [Entomospira nematocera]
MFRKIWRKLQKSTRAYSDNLLRAKVKEALLHAKIASVMALDAAQRESRLIMLINALLLAFAFYFNDYIRISRILALSIFILLILRLIYKITRLSIWLYKTRHTGFIYYWHRYWIHGGIRHHSTAFKEVLYEIFTLEYATRISKHVSYIHDGLSKLQLTHSQEEIFEYFYTESVSRIRKFFFSTILLLIVEVLAYLLLTVFIRRTLFRL